MSALPHRTLWVVHSAESLQAQANCHLLIAKCLHTKNRPTHSSIGRPTRRQGGNYFLPGTWLVLVETGSGFITPVLSADESPACAEETVCLSK